MIKEKVRNCIETYQKGLIQELRKELSDKVEASVIDEIDVIDIDSHSHQAQSQDEEQNINNRLNNALESLAHLQTIPLANSNKVTEGALIETKNLFIYVGIITQNFTEEGKNIIGISTAAPIFKMIQNQSVGFPFEFAGVSCEILSIT